MKKSAVIMVSNCLSDDTRKERRNLLTVSVISVAMTHARLIPAKISALGIEFEKIDQSKFLIIFSLIVTYFLCAFLIYGVADFSVWRIRFGLVATDDTSEHKKSLIAANREDMEGPGYVYDNEDEYEEIYLSKNERETLKKKFAKLTRSEQRWIGLSPAISIIRGIFDFLLPAAVALYAIYSLVFLGLTLC